MTAPSPDTSLTVSLNTSGLTNAQHRLLHAMIRQCTPDGTVILSPQRWRSVMGQSTASAARLMHHCERIAATLIRWNQGQSVVRVCALVTECHLMDQALHAQFPAAVVDHLNDPAFSAILAVDRRRLLKRPLSRRLYDVLDDMATVGTEGWWPIDRLWRKLHPRRTPPPPPPISTFKRRIIEPALAELERWTDLAVAVDYRRNSGGDNAIRFHVARRADPEPACLLLPQKDGMQLDTIQAQEQAFDAYKAARVCEITGRMSAADRDDLEQAFADSIRPNPILFPKYSSDGLDNLSVRLAYQSFLEHRLLADHELDPMRFKAQHPDPL